METYVIVGIGIVLISITKYYEDRFCLACLRSGRKIVSILIGAISISVFVELLDEVYMGIHATRHILVLFIPTGFIVSLLIEKHIYNHTIKERLKELSLFAKTISFISGLIIGILAFQIVQDSFIKEIFFLIILASYDMIRDLSMHVMHEDKQAAVGNKIISRLSVSLSPICGVLIAWLLPITEEFNVALLAVFGGAMTYIIAKELLPREERIETPSLMLGSLLTILIYLLSLSI